MIARLRRIGAIARKELRQLLRDRLTLGMIVGIPTIQLILFGYAIDMDVRHVATAVLDRSQTHLSRQILGELAATQTFALRRRVHSEQELFTLLERGRIGAGIVIPADLDRRLMRGRGADIAIFADASNPTVAAAIALAGQGFSASLAARLQPLPPDGQAHLLLPADRRSLGPLADLVRPAGVQVEVLPFYNPERRTPVFIVPGLVGVILTMTMMLMTALAVVRERERGTFEFLIATPVRRTEVMVGKILPYVFVGLLQVGLILTLGAIVFAVPIHGNLGELAAGSAVFIGAMLAMGLGISSLAKTQFQAVQLSFFFFLPSMLLSGFMFPFEAMPRPAQWLGELLPLTHFLRIVRGILLKGARLETLASEVAAIAAFALVALAVSVTLFRKRLD